MNTMPSGDPEAGGPGPTTLDMVLPVLNEEVDLPINARVLHDFMAERLGDYEWRVVVADNGSTDSTLDVAKELSQEFPRIQCISLEHRGRGRALRHAWTESKADIVGYMDVDLSTDLEALPTLVDAVRNGTCDIATGSRLIRGADVKRRPFKREVASRGYSLVFRTMFLTKFRDAQCGFKALNRRTVENIVPLVRNQRWFFDTEMLILAEKNGYVVREIPVKWTDDPDTRVHIAGTAYEDMRGLLRLRFGGLARPAKLSGEGNSPAKNTNR